MSVGRQSDKRGFTVTELIVVIILVGVAAAFAIPRALKSTPRQDVTQAARQLTRDLEQVRTRAMSAKRNVRFSFDESADFYTAFMDTTAARRRTFMQDTREVHESKLAAQGAHDGLPGVRLSRRVTFGAGDAGSGPLGEATDDPILLADDRIEFDSRGMAIPLGTRGVIFLTHADDPSVVAAITISGAGAFQTWHYRGGSWER